MSKDPAFLFYHQDFFTGVSDMTNEEVGAYIKCLCIQASKGGITEKHMSIICQSHEVHNSIKVKFILNSETNLFENARLKSEIEKRKKYSESRSANRKNTKKIKEQTIDISKSYDKHMENENEIENEDRIVIKNENEKINFREIAEIFNSVCSDLPNVEKITDARKKAIEKIVKEYSLEKIGDVFKNVNESDFLSGRKSDWKANFDWILNPKNFVKILEGNYKNLNNGQQSRDKSDADHKQSAVDAVNAMFGIK